MKFSDIHFDSNFAFINLLNETPIYRNIEKEIKSLLTRLNLLTIWLILYRKWEIHPN